MLFAYMKSEPPDTSHPLGETLVALPLIVMVRFLGVLLQCQAELQQAF